ncbi:putative sensor histidine protein kinase [Sinorhizobium fredii NGR234]|uniref:histidine kinase n=1 Tax=Sinorhizobium fredii (strain NBRC 101917 / NGR234) TaxID=394 RepID=C3M9N6_SINFN|nr:histidine kinase dimerization/phosphoacceptor domain -containing protein [Sinorhizobium fredii]ACP26811.1 putative sensor histidine protein kinase [Sinorhizobium fredii NGR234]
MISRIKSVEDARSLAVAIVETIPEPFVVLDDKLGVIMASRSFYRSFKVDPAETLNRPIYELGNGQWDIPALRLLLGKVVGERTPMENFEVEHDFPNVGQKIMLLSARSVLFDGKTNSTVLLGFVDVTARRLAEREKEELHAQTEELLRQKNVLLQELQHRVANSLQIIASILMLKARAVNSEETRDHLEDARQRVMSVAAVQQHLNSSAAVDKVEVGPYLSKLCQSLAESMIGGREPIAVKVLADHAEVDSGGAVNIGLIVTELLINAIKHAFPTPRADAQVLVTYKADAADWQLTVSDNGIGKSDPAMSPGLGTTIVKALVEQLNAELETSAGPRGTTIVIARMSAPRKHRPS